MLNQKLSGLMWAAAHRCPPRASAILCALCGKMQLLLVGNRRVYLASTRMLGNPRGRSVKLAVTSSFVFGGSDNRHR